MSDAATSAVPAGAADAAAAKPPSLWRRIAGVAFTDDGCRLEIRLGGLLLIAGIFLWQFMPGLMAGGLRLCALTATAGGLLIAIGAPIQAIQARRGRPGYPWKLAVALTVIGGFMLWDLRYAEAPGGPVHLHQTALMLSVPGWWLMLWWAVAGSRRAGRAVEGG